MAIIVSSKNNEKAFTEKEVINIGTNPNCDFVMDSPEEFMLTINVSQNND